MENSIFLIQTYWRDLPKAELVKRNLILLGIEEKDIFIIEGYDHKEIGKIVSHTLYKAFKDKFIPKILEQKKNFYYLESNTIIYENPRYFPKYKPIHWLGFIKHMKHYIVGAHLVYFDYEFFVNNILPDFKNQYPSHIDRMFRRWGLKYGMEIDKSITQIAPHYSYNLKKVRENKMNKYFYLSP